MERVQCEEYEWDVFRDTLQPAPRQLECVQCDEYALYVSRRKLFQPAAQQLGRVQ